MQAVRVQRTVLRWRNVQLHRRFVVAKEQPLDVLHLGPVRATRFAGNRNVIPTLADAGDDAHRVPVHGRRNEKRAARIVAVVFVKAVVPDAVGVQQAEVSHSTTTLPSAGNSNRNPTSSASASPPTCHRSAADSAGSNSVAVPLVRLIVPSPSCSVMSPSL
jgi:hypothetical protein